VNASRGIVIGTCAVLLASCDGATLKGPTGSVVKATSSPSASRTGSPAAPPPVSSPPATPPSFDGSISKVTGADRRSVIGSSWREGCPVPVSGLRVLRMNHWGFDGVAHPGVLVVSASQAAAVLGVFRQLFDGRFPIRRMQPVSEFGSNDERSMAADNTSGFNCRYVAGQPGVWSQHAYGLAVDVNPLENPYVMPDGTVKPPGGGRFMDRSLPAKGMIHVGDLVVRAFASIGWGWGGSWSGAKDYQHFSANSR
jgi:hypothetical protein